MRPRISDRPQRKYRRCTVRIMVEYETANQQRTEPATTLGAGGLFIETPQPLRPGSEVALRFRVHDGGNQHHITGRVVWARPPKPDDTGAGGMGIEFTQREAAVALAIELEQL